jgi:hypothetical protein
MEDDARTTGGFANDRISRVKAQVDDLDFDDADRMTEMHSTKYSKVKALNAKESAKDIGSMLEGPLDRNVKDDGTKKPLGRVLISLNGKSKIYPAVNEKN